MSPKSKERVVTIPTTEEESAELARFRNEWRAEVQRRKAAEPSSNANPNASSGQSASVNNTTVPGTVSTSPPRVGFMPGSGLKGKRRSSDMRDSIPGVLRSTPGPSSETIAGVPASLLDQPVAALSQSQNAALDVYKRAVHYEQRGELDPALGLYRQAFRMNADVDKFYHRQELLVSILSAQQHPPGSSASVAHRRSTSESTKQPSTRDHDPTPASTLINLSQLVAEFPLDLKFEPEDETQSVPISSLPDEMLTMILRLLDVTSIARFGRVNRKAMLLSLDPIIWMELVRRIYKPPQIPDIEELEPTIQRYNMDYRRMFIEHPRVRLDGVYIAVCHYVRPGLSENTWVNLTHLITYHRYLRFFPNGQVISLLANEEQTPQTVIPLLKLGTQRKGLFLGTWELIGTTIQLTNLIETKGKVVKLVPVGASSSSHSHSHSQHHSSRHADDDDALIRYAFTMELSLKSKPKGRWNRLDIEVYDSVRLDTGDIVPVALKNERPFWFSKVRSYAI